MQGAFTKSNWWINEWMKKWTCACKFILACVYIQEWKWVQMIAPVWNNKTFIYIYTHINIKK